MFLPYSYNISKNCLIVVGLLSYPYIYILASCIVSFICHGIFMLFPKNIFDYNQKRITFFYDMRQTNVVSNLKTNSIIDLTYDPDPRSNPWSETWTGPRSNHDLDFRPDSGSDSRLNWLDTLTYDTIPTSTHTPDVDTGSQYRPRPLPLLERPNWDIDLRSDPNHEPWSNLGINTWLLQTLIDIYWQSNRYPPHKLRLDLESGPNPNPGYTVQNMILFYHSILTSDLEIWCERFKMILKNIFLKEVIFRKLEENKIDLNFFSKH